MSMLLFLYNNLLDSATLTASSAAAGFPANNLKNPFRTKCWKTLGSPAGLAQLVIDHGTAKAVNCIALTGYSWLTAPGKLVMEFNDTDVWTAPSATETLTWVLPTTPGGNKGTILMKTSVTRTYRYNRLRVVSASGVTLTAAASGSNGLTHVDDVNLNPRTYNFSEAVDVTLPDYTPGSIVALEYKNMGDASSNFKLSLSATGYLIVTAAALGYFYDYQSTAPVGCVDGSRNTFGYSFTRQSASVAGSVIFTVNGVQLGAAIVVAAAAPPDINGATNKYWMGTDTTRTAGTIHNVWSFNRALTVADHLALHTTKQVATADQYGSQTPKWASNFSAGADGVTKIGGTATGNIDGIGGQDDVLRFYADGSTGSHALIGPVGLDFGCKYSIAYDYYIPAANTNIKSISATVNSVAAGSIGAVLGAWTTAGDFINNVAGVSVVVYFFARNAAGSTSFTGANSITDDLFYIKNVRLAKVGALTNHNIEGISVTDWQDAGTNNIDLTYPAAGCTVNGAVDFSIGRIFVGEYFEPTRTYGWGYQEEVVDPSLISQTIGGQDHADEIERYRKVTCNGIIETQAQWVLYQAMMNAVGMRKEIFAVFDYDTDPIERTVYGKFSKLPSITRAFTNKFDYDFEFTEAR